MSESRPLGERVAAMEARVYNLESAMSSVAESIERVEVAQQAILNELSRYRGAWGMLILVVSALAAVAGLTKDWLLGLFR